MDFDEAYQVVRKGYIAAGFGVAEQRPQLTVTLDESRFSVVEEDIATYARQYPQFETLAITPFECALCSPVYREQVITPVESSPFGATVIRLREGAIFGDAGQGLHVEVGRASELFKNRLRFTEGYMELCIDRMRRPILRRTRLGEEQAGPTDIRDTMFEPFTIRVHNIGLSSTEAAIRKSTPIIEACLFELSYLKEITLAPAEEWPTRLPRTRPFRPREIPPSNELPLPNVQFNSDIVRFYQRGVSTGDPVIQFLSFYQVLEYFFLAVSDERLYAALSHRLNDPVFKPSPKQLDRLIQDVLDHRRVTDETEMLKLVLQKHVETDELTAFIEGYEAHHGEPYYTKRKQIFGQDVPEVRFQEEHLRGNIAKRVKSIRNAIVHSSDRHERSERFVPLTPQSEEIIRKEIPLMKCLAERVIISTADH